MNKIILVILIVAITIFSFTFGVFYQGQKDSKFMVEYSKARDFLKNFDQNSKMLGINTSGRIEKIMASSLIVAQSPSKKMIVNLKGDTKFSGYDVLSQKATSLNISNLRVGDTVNVFLYPNTQGRLEANSVLVTMN